MFLGACSVVRGRLIVAALTLSLCSIFVHAAEVPATASQQRGLPFLDARYDSHGVPAEWVRSSARARRDDAAWQRDAKALAAAVPGVVIDEDELFLTPHFIASARAWLSGPGPSSPRDVVRAVMAKYPGLFQLNLATFDAAPATRDFKTDHNGVTHLTFQQTIAGVEITGCQVQANVMADGSLINIESTMLGLDGITVPLIRVSDLEALKAAANACGVKLACDPDPQSAPSGPERRRSWTHTPDLRSDVPIESRLVYFPVTPADVRAAWAVDVPVPGVGHTYDCVIDATTGELLRREDRLVWDSTQPVTLRVYTQDSPRPGVPGNATPLASQPAEVPRTLVTVHPADVIAFSPNGWIDDGGTETIGNNCDAHTDADSVPDSPDLPRPSGGAGRVFDFPIDLSLAPSTYRQSSVTQLFYLANWYHDRLFALGFNEAAHNFQQVNFSGVGAGGDRVLDDCQDASGTNNATFLTTRFDGSLARAQFFVWTGASPSRDGALDAQMVFHEHTHGLSIRLVNSLSGQQAGGMGEGWSDFFGLCLCTRDGMDPDAVYPSAPYATYNATNLRSYYFGGRRFPYCTDMSKNPETYDSIAHPTFSPTIPINSGAAAAVGEVHATGEIWCTALWEARAALYRRYGFAANDKIMRLVVDGMKLCPSNPTFVQARTAILQADLVAYPIASAGTSANANALWWAFAKRGLGASASSDTTNAAAAVEAFDVPGGVSFTYPAGLPDTLSAGTPTLLRAAVTSRTLAVTPGTVRLFTSVNAGEFVPSAMALDAESDYTGQFASTPPGANVRYYLSVETDSGPRTDPQDAPLHLYVATVSRCVADVDDGSASGAADGSVTIDDLLAYITRFAAGATPADLDDGTGSGTPDGSVTVDDLLYYLAHFEAGC